MKNLLRHSGFLSLIILSNLFAQSLPPKREFRGAWIATVINLDWPSAPGLDPATQRGELIRLLDELQAAGVNAVMFQVRSECDAMYASTLEPWSYWLTGRQGRAPNPFYDPLQFAVQEAHKRGIELHAWFNPYRSVRAVGNYTNAANHVSVAHPDWILTFTKINLKLLDPGLSQVRQHVTDVVMDVVNHYDVDGVHFDDYFYPYPDNDKGFSGITTEDNATFANYSRGFINRGDWRRDNVNLLVTMIHDSIQVVKPHVKFGISPFGVRKNSDAGTSGLDAYSTIYCDAVAWLNAKTVDYLTPQVYWAFARPQVPYGTLVPWWASVMNGLHLYVGHGAHNMTSTFAFPVGSWPASELTNQIRFNRRQPNVAGSVFFRTKFITDNTKGFADSLKTGLYRHPSLMPIMIWKDVLPPNAPQNLRYERIAGISATGLRWDAPAKAADGDTAFRYVVYRLNNPVVQQNDLDDPSKIAAIAGLNFNFPKTPASNTPVYYAVTALDRNSNESLPTATIMVTPPATALLIAPANGAIVGSGGVTLRWNYPRGAAFYQVQVARDSMFAALLVNEAGLIDTFKVINGLDGQVTYYWRVQVSNAGGVSAFSPKGYFTTGFPVATTQVAPLNNVRDVLLDPTVVWHTAPGASAYQMQIASNSLFEASALVYDTGDIADTTFKIAQLEINKFYFWRVRAKNAAGESNWSVTWRFKTIETTGVDGKPMAPAAFALYQNYPNPFNPATTILFELPKPGMAQLIIYDGLGQEAATLLNEFRPAGRQEVNFYAYDFPSGIYYYRLKFEGQVLTRRLTILK